MEKSYCQFMVLKILPKKRYVTKTCIIFFHLIGTQIFLHGFMTQLGLKDGTILIAAALKVWEIC